MLTFFFFRPWRTLFLFFFFPPSRDSFLVQNSRRGSFSITLDMQASLKLPKGVANKVRRSRKLSRGGGERDWCKERVRSVFNQLCQNNDALRFFLDNAFSRRLTLSIPQIKITAHAACLKHPCAGSLCPDERPCFGDAGRLIREQK